MHQHFYKYIITFSILVYAVSVTAQENSVDTINYKTSYSGYDYLYEYYQNNFKPFKAGSGYIGLAFSLTDKQSENTKGLLQNTIEGNNLNYHLTFKGGYYTGNYGMAGLNIDFYENKFLGQVYREPDTIQSKSLSRGFRVTPNFRTSIPLTKNERLSFFTRVGVSYGMETGNVRDTKNLDEISTKYSTSHSIGVGLSPGVTFFAMENFAFEVSLDVLGYNVDITNTTLNGVEESREVRQNVNFSIDLLSLELGLAYYIGAKK